MRKFLLTVTAIVTLGGSSNAAALGDPSTAQEEVLLAASTGSGQPFSEDIVVRDRDSILFSTTSRSAQVSQRVSSTQNRDQFDHLCRVFSGSASFEPPKMMKAGTAYDFTAGSRVVEAWMRAVTESGTRYAVLGDQAIGERTVALLFDWANAGALLQTPTSWGGFGSNTSGAKRNALQVVSIATYAAINAYLQVRGHAAMTASKSEVVESWIDRLFEDYTTGHYRWYGDRPNSRRMWDNSRLKIDLTYLAYAILRGDDEKLKFSIKGFLKFMDMVRPDGSHPDGSARGSRAIWYSGLTILVATAFLEALENQGYTAYAHFHDGYHKMVRFFLDAIDDPEVIYPYAKEMEVSKGKDYRKQDLSFLRKRHVNIAWVEAYAARFPDHENTPRIKQLMGDPDNLYRDYLLGGNASCAFR